MQINSKLQNIINSFRINFNLVSKENKVVINPFKKNDSLNVSFNKDINSNLSVASTLKLEPLKNTFSDKTNANVSFINPNSENYHNLVVEKINELQSSLNTDHKLSQKQIDEIKNYDDNQKNLLAKGLFELEKLNVQDTNPKDYFINMLEYSADLAGDDNEKFANFVGEVFSEVPIGLDFFREILGAGPETTGNILEPILAKIVINQGGSGPDKGFNPNMTDDVDSNNTMTHHVGEFIKVGFNRGETLGKIAADVIDREHKIIGMKMNEGDVRSGYFAAMIGDSLNDNKINPKQAVGLIKWAYISDHGGLEDPPFGKSETTGDFMKWKDYKIEKWLDSYSKAFPS